VPPTNNQLAEPVNVIAALSCHEMRGCRKEIQLKQRGMVAQHSARDRQTRLIQGNGHADPTQAPVEPTRHTLALDDGDARVVDAHLSHGQVERHCVAQRPQKLIE